MWSREIVWGKWVPPDVKAALWQSPAEIYTPFNYVSGLGARRPLTRAPWAYGFREVRPEHAKVARLLAQARGQLTKENYDAALEIAYRAEKLAHRSGLVDVLDEIRDVIDEAETSEALLMGLGGLGAEVTETQIRRALDTAREKAAEGQVGSAISFGRQALDMAYEGGFQDLEEEARSFLIREVHPSHVDGVGVGALLSVIHDRHARLVCADAWEGPMAFREYLEEAAPGFESGRYHVAYFGADADSAYRVMKDVEEAFDAAPVLDPIARDMLYGAVT